MFIDFYYLIYYKPSQRSPAPVSGPGSGMSAPFYVFIFEIFPKMWSKITHPIYATLKSNIDFGDIFQPSASSPKNERPFPRAVCYEPAYPSGFLCVYFDL